MIGIYAIEQIESRTEFAAFIVTRQNELAVASANLPEGPTRELLERERADLAAIRARLVGLISAGAVAGESGSFTEIVCSYIENATASGVASGAKAGVQPPLNSVERCSPAPTWFDKVFLKDQGASSASGILLGLLILTASIGGACIEWSLDRREPSGPEQSTLRTFLRAMGGGAVCYLVIDGGSMPLNGAEVTVTNPATASLCGLLAGMFASKVFTLLSDLADAFIKRVTPMRGDEAAGKSTSRVAEHALPLSDTATARIVERGSEVSGGPAS